MVIDVRAINYYDLGSKSVFESAAIVSDCISFSLGLGFHLEYLISIITSNIEPFLSGLGSFLSYSDTEFSFLSCIYKCGHTVLWDHDITWQACFLKTECLNHHF